jgi:hypothetical protein
MDTQGNDPIKQILTELTDQRITIEKIHRSVEQTRKMILLTVIGSVLMVVLPLIGVAVAAPLVLNTLKNTIPAGF